MLSPSSSLLKRYRVILVSFWIVALWACSAAADDPAEARFQTLWAEADSVHTEGDFAVAEQLYKAILAEFPHSQRTALRIAICQEKAGRTQDALASYDAAINLDPLGYWAEVALFYKARACREANHIQGALDAVQRLRAQYPESPYNARAAVLEAQITGGDVPAAQALLEQELAAGEAFDQCMKASRATQDALALEGIEGLLELYPRSAVALRALEAKGHLLLRNKQYEEAVEPFLRILAQLGDSAPRSRIVQEARTRLAAIHHALYDRSEALRLYTEVLEGEPDPTIAANAALQAAGVAFEIYQRRRLREGPLPEERWDEVRALCQTAKGFPATTPEQRVRADLMIVETWTWQGDREKSVEAAEVFLDIYDEEEFKREVATAHLVAGKDLRVLKRYDEALAHLRWIVEAYPEENEIWPEMDHLPRTYFLIWQTLRDKGAPKAEVKKAGEELTARFPESSYTEHVRLMAQQKGWEE